MRRLGFLWFTTSRTTRSFAGGTFKQLKELLRNKLVHHENRHYDGYRLTYLGCVSCVRRRARDANLEAG